MRHDAITFAGIGDEAGPELSDQVRALKTLGWDRIELRNVAGTALADLDDTCFEQLRRDLDGLAVSCVDSRIANWGRPITAPFEADLDELAVLARRCAALGTPNIRVMSYPNDGLDDEEWGRRVIERMRVLAARAEDEGLVLLHENCAGWAGRSGARMLELVDTVDSPALRLLFDIGNGIAYGYDALAVLTDIVDRVAYVHVKDGRGDTEQQVYTMPGEGDCRVADCLGLLLDRGYRGTWSIEPHMLVRPHDGQVDAGADGVEMFVNYGRKLEQLANGLREERA